MVNPSKQPFNDYDLESALPYLLNRAGTRIAEAFSQEIKQHGISLSAWRVIASLYHREGQTLSELAEHTCIELSTLSRQAANMAKDKLLKRVQNGNDGRSIRFLLTAKGRKLAFQAVPLADLYERVALSGISPDDATRLKALLAKVYINLSARDRPGDLL